MEDIIVYSKNQIEHYTILHEVLRRIVIAKLKINTDKCTLFTGALKYLGFDATGSGIKSSNDRFSNPEKVTHR